MVWWSSHVCNENPYANKTASSLWTESQGKLSALRVKKRTNYIGNWILWVKHCWYDKVKAKLNQTVCIFHLQCCVSSAKEKYMEICQLVISQWCNGTPIFTQFDSISKNKDRVYGKWKYKVHKQRVLMHRHQGWNVRHGLCHIYMRDIYIYELFIAFVCFVVCSLL